MKLALLILFAVLLARPVHAENSVPQKVAQGLQLWSSGQAKAAIAVLEPLLASSVDFPDAKSKGVAWTVLGSSYLDIERTGQSRKAYEQAIEVLKSAPEARNEYAAALDNLGILEETVDNYRAAKSLSLKGRDIYQQMGNQAGMAIADTNLAVNAYVQRDYKSARRRAQSAQQEAKATSAMRQDDLAALDTVRSALALHEHHDAEAMSAIQAAIDRWTRLYGPRYFMLVNAYLLRAQVEASSGSRERALSEGKLALDLAEFYWGRNSIGFWNSQAAYARVLRNCGAKEEARRLSAEARQGLDGLEHRQCDACTINVSSFR